MERTLNKSFKKWAEFLSHFFFLQKERPIIFFLPDKKNEKLCNLLLFIHLYWFILLEKESFTAAVSKSFYLKGLSFYYFSVNNLKILK
jgi:hypothetical protein